MSYVFTVPVMNKILFKSFYLVSVRKLLSDWLLWKDNEFVHVQIKTYKGKAGYSRSFTKMRVSYR